jgi:4-alpha-glucanotransferase
MNQPPAPRKPPGNPPGSITELARRFGFQTEWQDAHGRNHKVKPEVLQLLLERQGLACGTEDQLKRSLVKLDAQAAGRQLPPLMTAEVDRGIALPASVVRTGARYRIELEQGGVIEGVISNVRGEAALLAPIAEPGYHTLQLDEHRTCLAVAPSRCFSVNDAHAGSAPPAWWALAVQIYGLRQEHDGGVGTYSALAAMAREAAAAGAQALAISPVHAMFSADTSRFSPYSPSSRLMLNVLHIDAADAFGPAAVERAIAALGLADELADLEKLELIDWPRAGAARLKILRHLFDALYGPQAGSDSTAAQFDQVALTAEFEKYRAEAGQPLEDHARFEALHAEQIKLNPEKGHWRAWPAELQDVHGEAVAQFATAHASDVSYHAFLQWLATRGLAKAQDQARAAGMKLGLIADLAVGCDSAGSHAWCCRDEMLEGVSVGAPPDIFNPHGQSWGLTTFSPRGMRMRGFGAFIDMLRSAFAHAGGIRIDHILGLRRLWLVPEGHTADQGAYLNYPLDDMLRLIALESWRHRGIVIGEDLGTVPAGFGERLSDHSLLGIRVLWFERGNAGDESAFKDPEDWDRAVSATTTTHDLPTVAGWWCGNDIEWRDRVGHLAPPPHGAEDEGSDDVADNDAGMDADKEAGTDTDKDADKDASEQAPSALVRAQAERAQDRQALWDALGRAGLRDDDAGLPALDQPPIDAAVSFVALTLAPLVTFPIEDILGLVEQPNLPGSIDEHPNWRRRLQSPVAHLFDEPAAQARLRLLRAQRPGK